MLWMHILCYRYVLEGIWLTYLFSYLLAFLMGAFDEQEFLVFLMFSIYD